MKTTYPTHALLSLITGRLTPPVDRSSNGFADMHELAEALAGRAIFTHMFASRELNAKLRDLAVQHAPSGDVAHISTDSKTPESYLRWADWYITKYPTCTIDKRGTLPDGVASRAFHDPIKGKSVIGVVA